MVVIIQKHLEAVVILLNLWYYDNGNIVEFTGANATDSFNFEANVTGKTDNNGRIDNVEIMAPLKYWSKFWRALAISLINGGINFILTWSENCVIIYVNNANQNPTFEITETKLYVPVVTLSIQDNAKLLQQLKSGFKRTIDYNEYLQKPELLAQNPHLNHLVEPGFQGINRLFV